MDPLVSIIIPARNDAPSAAPGATGFIGRHVVTQLLVAGRRGDCGQTPCWTDGEQRVGEIFGETSRQSLEVVEADLANPAVIQSEITRLGSTIHTVIHCAGETSFLAGERQSARSVQIDGPLALLKCSAIAACAVGFIYPRRLFAGGVKA